MLKNNLRNGYYVAASILVTIIGIVYWGPAGAVLTIASAAVFFILGSIFTVTELKAMKTDNLKKLYAVFFWGYILSFTIITAGFLCMLYSNNVSGFDGLGYLILSLLIVAAGLAIIVCLTVWLIIRKMIIENRRN